GEELLGANSQTSIVGGRSMQEGRTGGSALVGQDLGVDDPRRVIDGHVDEFPPRTADGVAAIAGHAVPAPPDSSQFLDVQVDEFAGTLSLITDNGRSGRPPATEALTLDTR